METLKSQASGAKEPICEYGNDIGSITDAYCLVSKLLVEARKMKDGEMMCDELLKLKSILSQL